MIVLLFRFLIWSLLIFLLARLIARMIDGFVQGFRQPQGGQPRPQGAPPKSAVEYKDVADAKFIDVPNSSDARDAEKDYTK